MTFLKKIGQTILNVVGIASGLGPLFVSAGVSGSTMNTVGNDLNRIAQAVATTEAVIGAISDPNAKTGSQKLKAATPLVAQVIQTSELVAGKHIANEALFTQGCQKVTDGMADILNSFSANAVNP